MKVIVFGGTGSIGRLVVEQAIEQGDDVTLFTRDRAAVRQPDPRVHVVEGNVFDAQALAPVLAGHDAVVITLGGGRKGGVRARGTAAIIEAMRATEVRRLVVQSTIGVGDSREQLNFFWKRLMFGLLLRGAVRRPRRARAADPGERPRLDDRASGLLHRRAADGQLPTRLRTPREDDPEGLASRRRRVRGRATDRRHLAPAGSVAGLRLSSSRRSTPAYDVSARSRCSRGLMPRSRLKAALRANALL